MSLWLWPHQLDELHRILSVLVPEAEATATAENQQHNELLAEGQKRGFLAGKPRRVGRSEDA